MSDIFDWIQSYWFELGSLTAQFAILAVVVWYARTSLRILAASQRQAEPATRPSEAPAAFAVTEEPAPAHGGVGRMLSAMPEAPVLQAELVAASRVKRVSPWQATINWLRAPMYKPTNQRILTASQRQAEPAVRPSEASAAFAVTAEPAPVYGGVGRFLSPMPAATARESEPVAPQRVNRVGHWQAMINWLRAPIGSGSRSAA
jgi:hypothetical protein